VVVGTTEGAGCAGGGATEAGGRAGGGVGTGVLTTVWLMGGAAERTGADTSACCGIGVGDCGLDAGTGAVAFCATAEAAIAGGRAGVAWRWRYHCRKNQPDVARIAAATGIPNQAKLNLDRAGSRTGSIGAGRLAGAGRSLAVWLARLSASLMRLIDPFALPVRESRVPPFENRSCPAVGRIRPGGICRKRH
jgi:hypothetical protein